MAATTRTAAARRTAVRNLEVILGDIPVDFLVRS
jgi:hypothetical protein